MDKTGSGYSRLSEPQQGRSVAVLSTTHRRRTSACLVASLTFGLLVIVVSVAFLTATYIHVKQIRSCSCPTEKSYHISGYDPEIEWESDLTISDSLTFQKKAKFETEKLKFIIEPKYHVEHIELMRFGPARIADGSIFYVTVF